MEKLHKCSMPATKRATGAMNIIKIALYSLITCIIVGCKGADTEPYTESSLYVRNPHVAVVLKDNAGRDITSPTIGSREIAFFITATGKALQADLDTGSLTWRIRVPQPNVHDYNRRLKDGDMLISWFTVAGKKNQIKLRCIFRYNDNRMSEDELGGTGLTLLRIEDEEGMDITKEPLRLQFKFDIFNRLHLVRESK